MANNLLTSQVIVNEALRLFMNDYAFMRRINRQYDDRFAQSGAKIGNTINIRLPVDYTVGNGPTVTPQNTIEKQTSLTITNQANVAMSFGSAEMALSLDLFSDRVIKPAVNVLAASVASNIMSAIDGNTGQGPAQHFVHNTDANGNTISPTAATILAGGAILTNNGFPRSNTKPRIAILSPTTESRVVAGLSGYFNPQAKISSQYESGMMSKDTLGFDFYSDVTVLNHATGSFSATANTVNGANQSGTVINCAATTGTLKQGDVITIAGVSSVNRLTKVSTNIPRQFTVQAAVPAGSTSIPIGPALIPSTAGAQTQYQTVDVSPASGAVIALVNNPNETYRNNLLFVPEALTMATVDLELPTQFGAKSARQVDQGVSMRYAAQWNAITDQFVHRLDVLYGWALVRPEWVVRLGDSI